MSVEPEEPELDSATVAALGKLSEAFEVVEEARGRLYGFHRLCGTADFTLGDAVKLLRAAGHHELATRIDQELVGRNVLHGRWSYQIVEEYDDGYYSAFKRLEAEAREELAAGRRHTYESSLKERRRSHGQPGHERRP